jgi:hypothetical protein
MTFAVALADAEALTPADRDQAIQFASTKQGVLDSTKGLSKTQMELQTGV